MKKPLRIIITLALLSLIIPPVLAWEIERPSNDIDIKEKIGSVNTNGEASVALDVNVDDYDEGASYYAGNDCVEMNISMASNSRRGITYSLDQLSIVWVQENQLYYRNDMIGIGDDAGFWVNFPQNMGYFVFRLYGGVWSAEYEKVWVSSNGFIGFDPYNQTAPVPSNIPDPAIPNALVAGVWSDLNVDSSASIITGLWYWINEWYFVITWKNVLHKASGNRLTFQIILENAPQLYPIERRYGQSDILISYQSVSSINTQFAYGIEDHEGLKGVGQRTSGANLPNFGGHTLVFTQSSDGFFLKSLKLTLREDDTSQTIINVLDEAQPDCIRGYHVRLASSPPPERDPTLMFVTTLAGTATLLLGGYGGIILYGVSIADTVLVTMDWADLLALYQYSSVEKPKFVDWAPEVYLQVPTYDYTVDATLDMVAHWVLYTPNDSGSHSLTVTAQLEYFAVSMADGTIIQKPPLTTSVNLKIGHDNNNNFSNATLIQEGVLYSRQFLGGYDQADYFKIHADLGHVITVYGEATSTPAPDFSITLYDPGQHYKKSSGHGYNLTVQFIADSTGDWFIKTSIFQNYGFYRLWAYVTSQGPGGGLCPFVSVWNGGGYVPDNNVMPRSILNNGTDVEDYYGLEQTPVPVYQNQHYSIQSLMLSEFASEHSYFDQVKLMAVDHNSDVNIAVTSTGQILTYKNPAPPTSSVDQDGNNRLNEISAMDGNVSDPATYFYGLPGDYLLLNFGQVSADNAKLIFRDDMKKEEDPCINVQVLDANSNWQTVEVLVPRAYWSIEAVNIKPYVIQGQDLWIRLYWSQPHRLDYVGLDTTPQDSYQLQTASLVSAVHSVYGNVKAALAQNDNIYAELTPNQQIYLAFKLPNNEWQKRTLIFYSKGHYFTIP